MLGFSSLKAIEKGLDKIQSLREKLANDLNRVVDSRVSAIKALNDDIAEAGRLLDRLRS